MSGLATQGLDTVGRITEYTGIKDSSSKGDTKSERETSKKKVKKKGLKGCNRKEMREIYKVCF